MASYNFGADDSYFFNTFPTQTAATQSAAENESKRKFVTFIDLTEEDDVDNGRGESQAPPTADSNKRKFEKTVNDEAPFAQFDNSYDLDDHRSRKKRKADITQSAQMNSSPVQEQLPFKCETCHQCFDNVAELIDHYDEHRRQQYQQQHPPPFSNNAESQTHETNPRQPQRPIRCRKCHQTFTSTLQRDHHYQTSPRHFCCRYCPHVVAFNSPDSLHYHYSDRHHELYCHLCRQPFTNPVHRDRHMATGHASCSTCRRTFLASELFKNRCRTCHSNPFDQDFPQPKQSDDKKKNLPNHYATLGISANSSHDEILKAAKEMRVKMHPDRRKRKEGLSEEEMEQIDAEAALVGQAADVLSDPGLRVKYDAKGHGGWSG